MIAKILVSTDLELRKNEASKILEHAGLKKDHPDLLYFEDESKLGVSEVKKIKRFLSLKPYQAKGKAVVLESAHNLTLEAQNALLKTLEEPPAAVILLLGAESESSFLPTVLSRCQVVILGSDTKPESDRKTDSGRTLFAGITGEIERLRGLSIEERFKFIESLEEKEQFFNALVRFSHQKIKDDPRFLGFAKLVLEAEAWNNSHVNHRAILEYLMLELPKTD